jgi:glutathione synthase/RimK-type ligase-like ATP-grasp enzyme
VHAKDPNLNVIIETVTHYGRRTIMAQRYISAIVDGDKRVLLMAASRCRSCSRAYRKPVKPAAIWPPAAPVSRVS